MKGKKCCDLRYLFNPRSIAIIGATPKKDKASYTIMKNLLSNYKGKIYLVNPNYDEIESRKAYKSVLDIPQEVDLGIVVVNASISNKVIEESIRKKVKFLVVITAGYKEIGGEGVKREQELIRMIKESNYSTRVVGPNCLGILDNNSNVDILFLPENKISKPPRGDISLIFQSGALGASIIDRFADELIGISRFVSYGNASDLNELDFLEYFIHDPKTKVIGLYLEGIKDGRKLFNLLKASYKPIVVIKGGKTDKGSKATLTHTGSLAGNYEIFKGMCDQTNTILANNFREFENYLKIFSMNPPMKRKEVLVVTNGGGFGVLAADEVSSSKLTLYEITSKEENRIRKFLPSYANVHNPLDLIGDANSERYKNVLNIFSNNNNIGAFLIIMLVQTFSLDENIVKVISDFKKKVDKPVVGVIEGGTYAYVLRKKLENVKVPVYASVNEAVDALEKLYLWSVKR